MSEQQFPTASGPRRWQVDVANVVKLWGFDGARLERELSEMREHFGRWVLSVAKDGRLVRCPGCNGVLVHDRGVRCVACERPFQAKRDTHRPAWFGLLPPIGLDGLGAIRDAIMTKPPAQHVVGTHPSIGRYLLVPLVAILPAAFPIAPVQVHYLPTIRHVAGMPQEPVSHAFHMLPNEQMCLFAGSEWQSEMSCRETLQQRAYAHVIKLLNYANGKKSAFAIVS
ncbi:MAG: hypothetical protein IT381_02575 [Deltaproteobacteria bacterium]|nr:hypothetical protein [Deltaproteobacteria bacterium]